MNSSVFNWRLKDASEDNDVRDLDRLFHDRAAATGIARSPAVERRVGGTTSVDVDDERRRWRANVFYWLIDWLIDNAIAVQEEQLVKVYVRW